MVGYDLIIASALAIPGAVAAGWLDQGAADIRVGALPTELDRVATEPIYQLERDTLIFSAPRVATYRCRPDEVQIAPLNDADPEEVIALLISTALPAILWLRGEFVLHAAAAMLPGEERALAIMGPSGIGKSTAIAELVRHGACLVADDTVRLGVSLGATIASGLAGGYHLGASRAFHAAARGRSVRRSPLGAILALSQTDGPPSLTRLATVEAVRHLLLNRHRPRIPDLLGRRADVLRFCVFLASTVPVYSWHRRRGATNLDADEWDLLTRCGRNRG